MANTKTTDESAASALTGTELIRGVQSGSNVKITANQLKTFVGVTEDTIANILLLTPTAGKQAFATDIDVMLIADGANWYLDSSYYTQLDGTPDMGAEAWSNRIGYDRDYVTDKLLANCAIGYGGTNNTPDDGDIRFNPTTGLFQIGLDGAWQGIPTGVALRYDDNQLLESQTAGGDWLRYFGDSESLGLNGLPIVQGGHVSIGAYPAQQVISGGSF